MSLIDGRMVNAAILIMLGATLITTGYNTYQVQAMQTSLADRAAVQQPSQEPFTLPTGTPAAYGEELQVQYDDVSTDKQKQAEQVINKFVALDQQITLTENQKVRYIHILYDMEDGISCEYCCEAQSIITEDGKSGCGCAHAFAMRGLTKYLLTEHPDMSDKEIFAEVGKWKARYFPQQTKSKAAALTEQGVEPTFVNVAANTYRGVQSSGSGWVGDC